MKYFTCSGTLISDRHVLTSPDCFMDIEPIRVGVYIKEIILGAHDVSAASTDHFRQVVDWSSMSYFLRSNSSLNNYICLMTLSKPVTLNGNNTTIFSFNIEGMKDNIRPFAVY